MGFSVRRRHVRNSTHTVAFDGDLDLTGAARLRGLLTELVESGAHTIEVDLSGSRSVDASAAGVLIVTDNALRRDGGRLHIVRGADRHEALATLLSDKGSTGHDDGSRAASA